MNSDLQAAGLVDHLELDRNGLLSCEAGASMTSIPNVLGSVSNMAGPAKQE